MDSASVSPKSTSLPSALFFSCWVPMMGNTALQSLQFSGVFSQKLLCRMGLCTAHGTGILTLCLGRVFCLEYLASPPSPGISVDVWAEVSPPQTCPYCHISCLLSSWLSKEIILTSLSLMYCTFLPIMSLSFLICKITLVCRLLPSCGNCLLPLAAGNGYAN